MILHFLSLFLLHNIGLHNIHAKKSKIREQHKYKRIITILKRTIQKQSI